MFDYFKIIHLFFVISWFAGLFYLPRLFVYHAMTTDQMGVERFKIMERKLYNGIMMPAMIISLFTGIGMLHFYAKSWPFWLHIKMAVVVLLICYHFYCGYLIKRFQMNQNQRSHIFYRIFNEIPVVFLFIILTMVVMRPT